jgi:hypothetical protein
MSEHQLIDYLGITNENVLQCTCGARLYPDCDVSSVSVSEEWERHLATHPVEWPEEG